MSGSNRLAEGLAAALALSNRAVVDDDDDASPQPSTMKPKPVVEEILAAALAISSNPTRPQQRRVQFSDVESGTVVPSRADMSAEEKRCIWYCVSHA